MWYVMWGMSRKEEALRSRAEEVLPKELYARLWLPRKRERRKVRGEWKEVETPLFKGYLFIDTKTPDEVHRALRKEKEYIAILKSGEEYVPLTGQEEEIIRRILGNRDVAGMSVGVIRGGELKVFDGPLRGMEQYVIHVDRHKRKAYLKMLLFGEMRSFDMGLEVVERS